ncbi:MAG: hypothetical protein ACRDC6_08940 [Shewanella sp.]
MKSNLAMALFSLSVSTLAIAVEPQKNMLEIKTELSPISIIIDNKLNITLLEARIKLKPTEEWIALGDITPGDNSYIVYDELVGAPQGLLQARQPNGQWINAMLKKEQDSYIEVVLETSEEVMTTRSWHNAKTDTIGGRLLIPGVFNEQGEEISYNFQPVSAEQRNYSYSGFCSGGAIGAGVLVCEIDSSPKVKWVGSGAGANVGITYGSFIMSKSASNLVGVHGDWGYAGALFYMHIWAPNMDFNGGGIAIGWGGGKGEYLRVNS